MGQVDIDLTWAKIMSEVPALGTTYKYGTDYVYFGYLPTQETTISLLRDNIASVLSTDKYGTSIGSIPLMKNISGAKDIATVCTSDTGDVQTYYVKLWKDGPTNTPVAELGMHEQVGRHALLLSGKISVSSLAQEVEPSSRSLWVL